MHCPECGGHCYQESADIGVGIIYGPNGCEECGWSDWPEYNQRENPKPHTDQFGGYYPPRTLTKALDAEARDD